MSPRRALSPPSLWWFVDVLPCIDDQYWDIHDPADAFALVHDRHLVDVHEVPAVAPENDLIVTGTAAAGVRDRAIFWLEADTGSI